MKKMTVLLTALLLAAAAANAEPLELLQELEKTVTVPLSGEHVYVYHYSYPQVKETEEAAAVINAFYRYEAEDAAAFEIPMNADYYRQQDGQEDVSVEITGQVTCNSDEFFSVLMTTAQDDFVSYAGNTFSRLDMKPGSTVALPRLLGLLDSSESDSWLEDRQTEKADRLVREMVWRRLLEAEDVTLAEGFTEENLNHGFFPEEDFYLDGTGNPVFFLQPGFAEESSRLLIFPISIAEILDEM